MIRLPGLIDPHVHLRDPGQTYKEDFETGTKAAIAGGFTTILDMPNNAVPITTAELLDEKISIAEKKIVCDTGFHFGSLGDNFDEFKKVQDKVFGLKVYLNVTTGNFLVDERVFEKICQNWPVNKPILVHAEEDVLEGILKIAQENNQRIHICHISSKKELGIILKAKENYSKITCGVTPHHLFLNKNDLSRIGSYGNVKPFLKTPEDNKYLWENLKYIDIIESDHAPHIKEEKESDNPPFGIANLETTLALLLTELNNNKISIDEILRLCYAGPAKIFGIQTNEKDTYIQVDEKEEWTVDSSKFFTKCKSSPYNGMRLKGRVKEVTVRGIKVFENGKFTIEAGTGNILLPKND